MNKTLTLTPQNFREVLTSQPETLQQGYITGYANLLINQPLFAQPPVKDTEAIFYLKLEIEPFSTSDIAGLYIRFEAAQTSYKPVEYIDKYGYVSKPVSHYAAIMDLLRSGQSDSRKIEVLLQANADGRNVLILL